MSRVETRRDFLRKAVVAAGLFIAGKGLEAFVGPQTAEAAEPRFKWHYTDSGVPHIKGDKLVPFSLITESGNAVVLVTGPVNYGSTNFEGQSKGKDYATLIIAYNSQGGAVNASVNVWPEGGWVGATKAKTEEVSELLRFAEAMIRDPKSGNGLNKDGVKGNVDYILIDTGTNSVKAGSLASDGIDYPHAIAQSTTVLTGEPKAYSLRVGERAVVGAGSIVIGDVQVDGNVMHDNNPRTGLVTIIDRRATVDAPYGAGVIQNPVSGVDIAAQMAADDLKANGCGTGNGCTDGVTVTRYPNGKVQR